MLRVVAAISSTLTMVKIFDWLRLFEDTAFYVLLVGETLFDVRYFLLLLLTTLIMLGVPLVILNSSSQEEKELYDGVFDFWVFDLMYNQYLLSLGEFGLDNFGDHPQASLVFVFFILATFFSQLTMMNMLIAIMGDSFAKVIENKEVNATKMKLSFLSDMSAVLPMEGSKHQKDCTNLFVAQPTHGDDEEGDEWQGSISRLVRVIERQGISLERRLNAQSDKIIAALDENSKKEND